jgi:multiple sugar transport system permease protein
MIRIALPRPHREQFGLLLLLLPYSIGLLLLLIVPALLTAPLAFTSYAGYGAARWVGLSNFQQAFADPLVRQSLRATLWLTLLAAPLRGLVALGLALLMRSPGPGRGLLRATAFLPTVMPEMAYALIWLYIFNPIFGPLNWLLPVVGQRPDAWLLEPGPANVAVLLTLLWTVGEGVLLLLAARREIPAELYEAAALDGAGPRAQFTAITLPLLLPFQLVLLCRDVIVVLGASFTAAQVITNGGPYYATSYLPFWIYTYSTDFGRLGFAAALNLALFGLALLPLVALLLAGRRWWRGALEGVL